MVTYKPLPLKQRTSSVDHRRDYSTHTWTSLLGLLKPREYFVTVDHFSIFRRHLAWAIEDGNELREYMTKRYSSSMVFMSLLLSTELGVLFNSSTVTTEIREALMTQAHETLRFWIGMCIIFSSILTILSLISTFTAWTMVQAVNETNAHCIFRSSIGQYCSELPGRFIVSSIYAFLVWVIMFFFVLMPFGIYSNLLLVFAAVLFGHTITTFSSFGRVIMHSGAMGSQRIFDPRYEETLLPHTLHNNLLIKAQANLTNNTSIRRQYRTRIEPLRRHYSPDELSVHLSERTNPTPSPPGRKRTESLVKFADGFDTTGNRVTMPETIHVRQNSYGTPMSSLSMDHPSSMGRPPLRGSNQNRHSRNWSLGSNLTEPSPTIALHKELEATDNSAIFAKWLSSENGGGHLSTVAEPSLDGSQTSLGSGSFTSSRNHRRNSPVPLDSTPSYTYPVPRQVGGTSSARSFSGASALDEMDKNNAISDEELFDQEYGQLFEPYDEEEADAGKTSRSLSERDRLLDQSKQAENVSQFNSTYDSIPPPPPPLPPKLRR